MLLYGGGLQLLERLRLRVQDPERGEITVREGKGDKERVTILPRAVIHPLHQTPLAKMTGEQRQE